MDGGGALASSHLPLPGFSAFLAFLPPSCRSPGQGPSRPTQQIWGGLSSPRGSGHSCHSSVCAGLARMPLTARVSFLSQPWAAWPYRYWVWGEKGQITAACAYPDPALCDPARVPVLAAVWGLRAPARVMVSVPGVCPHLGNTTTTSSPAELTAETFT